jgi:molecular chaperone GrpE
MFGNKKDEEKEEQNSSSQETSQDTTQVQDDGPHGCSEELGLVQDQLARLTADFQNYRKRTEKDRVLWVDRSRADVLLPLLDVVDNFDRALEDAKKNDEQGSFEEWVKGFELIRKSLYEFLAAQKVVPIEQVQVFDPHLHEAVVQLEVPDYRSGDIVEVMQKGFMFKERVLRTAKVSVAK